jgi:hypothetical protein
MPSKLQFLPVAATLFLAKSIVAADPPVSPAAIASINRSTAATHRGAYSPSAIVSIKNRARTLGNQPSPSNTRYFAVDDAALRGLQPELVIDRLSPSIAPTEKLRAIEIVVDIKKPISIWNPAPNSSVNIGTAVIQQTPLRRTININADISFDQIRVVGSAPRKEAANDK